MKSFLLATLASVVVVPLDSARTWLERAVGGALPFWVQVLVWLVGALGSSTMFALIWLRFVRPAIDTFIFESFQRRGLDYGTHMRAVTFRDDFARAERRDELARGAMDLGQRALAAVEGQGAILETVQSQHGQAISAIGVVAELVRNVAEEVGELRKAVTDRMLHGPYDRRS